MSNIADMNNFPNEIAVRSEAESRSGLAIEIEQQNSAGLGLAFLGGV